MITKEQAIDILEKFDFFQGQRAGRELWNDKPFEVQEQDIKDFARDVALLKEYIADVVPKSEVDGFPCVAYNKKHERYQVIHKGKDGRIFASKLYYTRKDAEKALAELKKKYTEEPE